MRRFLVITGILLAAALVLPPLWFRAFPESAPRLPAAGRRVAIGRGLAVNVIEAGAGPPVVLVHGQPGCAYDWRATMEALAGRGYRAIAYDRVGYGRSDGRPEGAGPVTVEVNAGELLALLAALDLRDVTLVGWSYGGGVSIAATRRDPGRVGRLVLIGSVGPGIEARDTLPDPVMAFLAGPVLSWVSQVPPVERRLLSGLLALAFDPEPAPPSALAQVEANFAAPHTLDAFRSEGRDLGRTADLDPSTIEIPMLVIQGQGDRLVPLAVAEQLHVRAPHSQLRVVPDAGHALRATQPGLVAEAIATFAGSAGS